MIFDSVAVSIAPVYRTEQISANLTLYDDIIQLNANGAEYHGKGKVTFEWLPSPSVRWTIDRDWAVQPIGDFEDVSLQLTTIPNLIRAQVTSIAESSSASSISGIIENGEGLKATCLLSYVKFHIANFIPFLGRPIRNESKTRAWAGRAQLSDTSWSITIDGLNDVDERALSSSRGYAITHVGEIRKVDGTDFAASDVKSVLDNLYWFFSFCRAEATPAILPVGYDFLDKVVWFEWGSWNVSQSSRRRHWYNDFSADGLVELFPQFSERMSDALWSDALKLAIYWYLEAADSGNDSTIVLTQEAFEVLAWTWIVEGEGEYSEDSFNSLGHVEKLNALLRRTQISSQLPTTLVRLKSFAELLSWDDGPTTVIKLRSLLVHRPRRKGARELTDMSPFVLYEAAALSLWYLELCILFLFSFRGSYSNRLVLTGYRGQEVEKVPWAEEGAIQ